MSLCQDLLKRFTDGAKSRPVTIDNNTLYISNNSGLTPASYTSSNASDLEVKVQGQQVK